MLTERKNEPLFSYSALWLACYTQDEIAQIVGCSDKSIVSRVIDDLLQNGDSAKLQQSPAALHQVDFDVPSVCGVSSA